MLNKKQFEVKMKFKTEVLGAKTPDVNAYITHVVEKTKNLIAERVKKPTTLIDASQISDEKIHSELLAMRTTIQQYVQDPITGEEWDDFLKHGFTKKAMLYPALKEYKGKTIFMKDESGNPYLEDYVMKGAIKDMVSSICKSQRLKTKGTLFNSEAYSMSSLNRFLHIDDEKIYFYQDDDCNKKADVKKDSKGDSVFLERSLRAKTMQGDRIALAYSETIQPPACIKFKFTWLGKEELSEKQWKDVFEMTKFYGISQWRNSGKGRTESVEVTEL